MNKLRWQAILMGCVILVITGFQGYWLKDNYSREAKALEIKTGYLFRETVRQIQDSAVQKKVQLILRDSTGKFLLKADNVSARTRISATAEREQGKAVNLINILRRNKMKDSLAQTLKGNLEGVQITLNSREHLPFDSTHLKNIDPKDIKSISVVKGIAKPFIDATIDSIKFKTVKDNRTNRSFERVMVRNNEKRNGPQVGAVYVRTDDGFNVALQLDSIMGDTIPLAYIEKEFSKTLALQKLSIPFSVSFEKEKIADSTIRDDFNRRMSFSNGVDYHLNLENTFKYLIKKISLPILFSVFLVSITILSFVLLYRSLLKQHKLATMKSDLISNITHELKTPIATVGVAIEALKNFNAIQDPARTKEYLDISQNELQRLGLLVDKVLKLSMFENKKIEIKNELFDLDSVINEVVASLRLQFEKCHARISVVSEGNMSIRGDRLHLLSVVFNLLDNALKYSKENASIQVVTKEQEGNIVMTITDNGIGIPNEYKKKVFDKFFRVPSGGDTHNAKGHGLGLSYVAQVIQQHNGTIEVDSHEGIGSTFIITLPKPTA